MANILFVCSANIRRSKTAEDYFAEHYPGHEYTSAGTNIKLCQREGTNPLNLELLQWADLIFVMETKHKRKILETNPGRHAKKITVLHIPDRYKYYHKELLSLLEQKVAPVLRSY